MFGTTRTYIITVVGPISTTNNNLVSYNTHPIVCISKQGIEQVWKNEQVKESVFETLKKLGSEHYDNSHIHVRVVDNKANISDEEWTVNEILEKWN